MVLSFKIDSRLKDILQNLADKENRSLSNYIITLLIRHLEVEGIDYKKEKLPKE